MATAHSCSFAWCFRTFDVIVCIFRLHPATCTEKSCHSAGKNLPRYRISLPVITNIGKM
jgi:hypothetical protein